MNREEFIRREKLSYYRKQNMRHTFSSNFPLKNASIASAVLSPTFQESAKPSSSQLPFLTISTPDATTTSALHSHKHNLTAGTGTGSNNRPLLRDLLLNPHDTHYTITQQDPVLSSKAFQNQQQHQSQQQQQQQQQQPLQLQHASNSQRNIAGEDVSISIKQDSLYSPTTSNLQNRFFNPDGFTAPMLRKNKNISASTSYLSPALSELLSPAATSPSSFNDLRIDNPSDPSKIIMPLQRSLQQVTRGSQPPIPIQQQPQNQNQQLTGQQSQLQQHYLSSNASVNFGKEGVGMSGTSKQANLIELSSSKTILYPRNASSRGGLQLEGILPRTASESRFALESPLFSGSKVEMMNQLKKKNSDNFYGKLIQQALTHDSILTPVPSSSVQAKRNSDSIAQKQSNSVFETNLNSIKSTLSCQLLELVKNDLYASHLAEKLEEPQSQQEKSNWKFKKLVFPQQEYYQEKFDAIQAKIVKNRESSNPMKQRLFSIISKKDQIVVHDSQNKDLMSLSDRKEAVSLAKWYEEMINQIYSSTPATAEFSPLFQDLQVVHQACILEIVRQVSLQCVERGQLLKRVWESLMAIVTEAFSIQLDEKKQFQTGVHSEIREVHQDCINKIDFYIPYMHDLTEKMNYKDALNKRILLEFRYLKKKNHQLEKLLRESKSEYQTIQKDYNLLAKQLEDLQTHNTQAEEKHAQEKSRMSLLFGKKLNEAVGEIQKRQQKYQKQLSGEVKSLKNLQTQFETQEKTIMQGYPIPRGELEDLEEKALFQHIGQAGILSEEPEVVLKDYYAEKNAAAKANSPSSGQNQSPELFEFEGFDGLRLVLASVATQVEEDLIQRNHKETDTLTLYTTMDTPCQTLPEQGIHVHTQTPNDWKTTKHQAQQSHQHISRIDLTSEAIIRGSRKSSEIILSPAFRLNGESMAFLTNDPLLQKYIHSPEEGINLKETFFNEIVVSTENLGKQEEVSQEDSDDEEDEEIGISFDNLNISFENNNNNMLNATNINIKAPQKNFNNNNTLSPEIGLQQAQQSLNNLPNPSRQIKQTLESTIRGHVENDIEELHVLLTTKMRFIDEVFEKILKNDLLKPNEILKEADLRKYLDDSQEFKLQQNVRFRNIWAKSRQQLQEFVKQKIALSEKQAEVEEANKYLDFGNGLYTKLSDDYETILQQLNQGGSSGGKKGRLSQINSTTDQDPPSMNSMNSIMMDDFMELENSVDLSRSQKVKFDESMIEESKRQAGNSSGNGAVGGGSETSLQNQFLTVSHNNTLNSSPQRPRFSTPVVQGKPAMNSSTVPSSSRLKKSPVQLKVPSKAESPLPITSNAAKTQINITSSSGPSTLKVQIDEEVDTSMIASTEFIEKSSSTSISSKAKQKFTSLVSLVINTKKRPTIKPNSHSTTTQDEPSNITENIVNQQILLQRNQPVDMFKNYRFKKHKLRRRLGYQSSPNSEAASNFLNTVGIKIMQFKPKKYKGPIFTEVNTKKYIGLIYNDKIKQIKGQDKSNPLHNVAYDFFLNKFGFKKLAEKNLSQFLRSLKYHSSNEKVKAFLRFFGIDVSTNYDNDDFNFYINAQISLDENLAPAFSQMNVYSIPRVVDILFKTFETKINAKILTKIKTEIESLKYVSNESNQKNKNVIDQDLGLQCLLQAKIEEKKTNIIALRPIYLAGDIDNDQVIGLDEFVMLTRHIEKELGQLKTIQLFSCNTDLIDEITSEKTMSFQQFAQVSVENNLFTKDKQRNYLIKTEEWDQIRNIQILRKHWHAKKDVLRLRFVKENCYKNFYRLMVQRIDEYFENLAQQKKLNGSPEKQRNSVSKANLPSNRNSLPSLTQFEETTPGMPPPPPPSNRFFKDIQKSSSQLPGYMPTEAETEAHEKKQITWLIYKLLDDESKRVMVEPQIDELVPSEFSCISQQLYKLAENPKFFSSKNKTI